MDAIRRSGARAGALAVPPHLSHHRTVQLAVAAQRQDAIRVSASLADPDHLVTLQIVVRVDGTVERAVVGLEDGPFPECRRASELSRRLEGLRVHRTGPGELEALLDKTVGCFHVLELAAPAFLFAKNVLASLRVGWDAMHPPGPETRRAMQAAGLTHCVAFQRREGP